MSSRIKSWSIAALALGAMALAAFAPAQAQNFWTAKGNNQRQGNNGNPVADNPGAASLRWFQPTAATNPNVGFSIVRTDTSTAASFTGTWLAPVPGGAAQPTFDYTGPSGLVGINTATPYLYSPVVPSAPGNNPLIPQAPFTASVFTWAMAPATSNDYALYFYLPPGPTVDAMGNFFYQPQFYVFEIDYGTGKHFIDVVDSHVAGYGWVRLGNGGGTTSALFHYDGVNPININLFNTVPRDAKGRLSGVATDGAGNLANTYLVYANAARANFDYGTIVSSPVLGTDQIGNTSLFVATNQNVVTVQNGQTLTQQKGVLQGYSYNTGGLTWSFTPNDQGNVGYTLAPPNAGVTPIGAWTSSAITPLTGFRGFIGSQYYYEPVTNVPLGGDVVNFSAANLADGSYDVQIWLPGPPNGAVAGYPVFAQNVQVEVDEGLNQTLFNVNLQQTNGWVSLSSFGAITGQRFTNAQGAPLVVKVSNIDTNAADAGELAFANAIRFVGTANLSITSTPVYSDHPVLIQYSFFDPVTNKNITAIAPKMVVVVCGEDGRIYCLDATGRGDGTTDIYWAYPSLPDPLNPAWTDPNNNSPVGVVPTAPDGSGGVTNALMPTGFSLSSPLIQTVGGRDFLYVAANNGRVYCLDMTGRGDNFLTTRKPGSTTRMWTFPNDYRPDSPNTPSVPSALGATNASVVFNNNPVSGPTLFVPSAQGRMYALDAGGNPAQTTTTMRWAFPAMNAKTVGPFNSTPAIDGAAGAQSIFAGTERKNANSPGQFFSLNVETGALNWVFSGDANATADDFEGGPVTAFNGLADGVAGSQYVFVSNQNGFIYALDNNNNGAVIWETNEMGTGTSAPLMFTYETVFDNSLTGAATVLPQPIVMVPDDAGQFYGLFASGAPGPFLRVNAVGGKLAYGYKADADKVYAGMASGHTFNYGADTNGYIYAWNGGTPGGGGGIAGPGNSGDILPPNDPVSQQYAGATIGFLNQATYNALRFPAIPPDYTTSTAPANFINRNPAAFDFGEILYIIIYNFPNPAAGPTPLVSITVSAEGRTTRQSGIPALAFSGAPAGKEGYAILAFPIHPAGQNMMAPGTGTITWSFQLTNGSSGGNNAYLMPNPGGQNKKFTVANPLGIAMSLAGNFGAVQQSLGADAAAFGNPANPQNAFNGSPSYAAGAVGWDPSLLYSSAGIGTHGSSAQPTTVYVYDRSLMELLNGPDNQVDGVPGSISFRSDRTNGTWNGGYGAVVKPFGGINGLYGGLVPILESWEDYPTQFPNVSLDYPDILREFILMTANAQTNASNPTFSPVTLPNPFGVLDAAGKPLPNPQNRQPNPLPLELDTQIPFFQPANVTGTFIDSAGNVQPGGYISPMDVFIDPTNSGRLSLNAGTRSAYRSFSYGFQVGISEHMTVLTPNLDLGALPEGAGLLANGPVALGNVLTPWADLIAPTHIYKPFQAVNDGNVNLLNVRVAKAYNNLGGGYFGWPFNAASNDELSYLDGSLYLWSSLDAYQTGLTPTGFSPSLVSNLGPLTRGEAIVQKPRIGAVSGTRITSNPTTFANGNIGTPGGTAMNPSFPIGLDPYVGITPAIGFPAGSYWDIVRLVEDKNYDLSLQLSTLSTPGEPFSDPTLSLSFTVREARLTNLPSPFDKPMADNNAPGGATNSFAPNIEPTGMRDRAFGNLFFAWSSNRTAVNNGALLNGDNAYRIYGASLSGAQPASVGSPLNELANFTPTSPGQWFKTAGPYPFGATVGSVGLANAAFGVGGTDHIIGSNAGEEDTVRFGQPALPNTGMVNPFVPGDATGASDFGHAIMAFTGSAIVQSASGRTSSNRIFATTVTPNSFAPATIAAPVPSTFDPDLPKSRPSVAQVGPDQAVIFYAGGSGGRSRLYYTLFNAATSTYSQTVPIETGSGFDTVTDPSAQARLYQGVDAADEAQTGHMIELTFSARLRGRANSEIFVARIPTDANGAPNMSNSNGELLSYFAQRSREQLEYEGDGIYRAVGIGWNPKPGSIDLGIQAGIGVPTSIINPGSPQMFDAQSGIMTLQTSLGVAYVNTLEGSVRFANSIPGSSIKVFATYQPKFLRLSVSKTAGLTGPVLLWDDRHVGSSSFNPASFQMYDRFWYVGNVHATLTDPRLLNNRYVLMYNRAAAGTGQSARPMVETLRLGVQVYAPTLTATSTIIPVTASGDVDFTQFSVAGTGNPYQVDPATGRIYFTALDEDAVVTVTIRGVPTQVQVGLLPERPETPVPIDQAINEGRVAAFVDPFDSVGANTRRPDLIWMLWTSTRTGTSDVFFQTIAPLLWPVLK